MPRFDCKPISASQVLQSTLFSFHTLNLLTTLSLVFLVVAAPARADTNACKMAETDHGLIITNLTANQGCEQKAESVLCRTFIACIDKHKTCLVSNGKVLGGHAATDFVAAQVPITFGVRRILGAGGNEFCFIASLGQAPGEESPSWDSLVMDSKGFKTGWNNQPRAWLRTPRDFLRRSEQSLGSVPQPVTKPR
jgi:hypothetical protein